MMVLWECSVGQIVDNDSVNSMSLWCHTCCLQYCSVKTDTLTCTGLTEGLCVFWQANILVN